MGLGLRMGLGGRRVEWVVWGMVTAVFSALQRELAPTTRQHNTRPPQSVIPPLVTPSVSQSCSSHPHLALEVLPVTHP